LRVLVTDGEDRAALAACRGLSRGGHTAAVAAGMRGAATHVSRACSERFVVPRSLAAEEFVTALADVAHRAVFDALLPASDAALLALSQHRRQLPPEVLEWLPPDETVARALRKAALLESAERAGFAVPETEECADREEAHAAAAAFGFPVVVKPSLSVVGGRREAARVTAERAALDEALAVLGSPVLVQRFYARASVVPVAGVAWNGRLAAVVAARWSRRWPPADGAASFAETIAAPPQLVEQVEALVAALAWQGIFELELLEVEAGRFTPVDFNPRPFGWMALALRAGANLPAVWADCLAGGESRKVVARPGMRYRWEDGDLKHLLWQLRRRNVRAAAGVLVPRRRVAHAWFELRDPLPFGAAFVRLGRQLTTRG
jgi:predicted ATP-grasp superfamily ATP-dependent carboligase